MVSLISKQTRDEIGLSSYWRAIVWAAISLKASISNPALKEADPNYKYENNVRIALGRSIQQQALQAALTIEATFPYLKSEGINNAGQFIPYLKAFYTGNPLLYTVDSCSTLALEGYDVTGEGTGLPDDPDYVDTLEKYLVWVCWEGERSLLDPLPSQLLPITVDFFEESTPDPTIKIKAVIPIDYVAYRASGNLVCSVLNPGLILTPAGLRAFSWEEITGKPTFHSVATSGNYADLSNKPTIPSNVNQLNGYGTLVRTINSNAPDPATGNVDLSLNVGSVDWANIQNRPTFHSVATSGNYPDLNNKPTIPSNVNQLTGYSSLVRSINGTNPDPTTGNVGLTVASDWASIQNKPTFATVAFSGSYNDLTNVPPPSSGNGGGGNLSILGKKIVFADSSTLVPFSSLGDNAGIINYLGTNKGTQAFSNPYNSGVIEIKNNTSTSTSYANFVDQSTSTFVNMGNMTATNLIFNFKGYKINPTKLTFYGNVNGGFPAVYNIQGSNDNSTWTTIGQLNFTANSLQWYPVDLTSDNFYQYVRLVYGSHTGTAGSFYAREFEFYGEIQLSTITDGSLTAQLTTGDLSYILFPNITVGNFILPDLLDVPMGSSFYIYNPHSFNLSFDSVLGQTLIKANNITTIAQNQSVYCAAITETEWIAF